MKILIIIIILAGILPAYATQADNLLSELYLIDHKIFSTPEYFRYEEYLEQLQKSKIGSKLEESYLKSIDAIFSRNPELRKLLLEQCDILYTLKEKYDIIMPNRAQGGC